MSEWVEKRLGEIIQLNPSTIPKNYTGKIQYIDISSVEKGKLLGYTEYYFDDAPGRARRRIKIGDIIYSTVRPNLQAYWYVRNCQENTIVSTGFAVIRTKSKNDPRFIYSLVTEKSFIDYLTLVAKGSNYPAVDKNDFEKAKIRVPDYPVQKRIGDIISAYDDAIENNNRRIALLEKAAKELYKEWFVHFRFPGHETAKFVGGLPEGWEVKKLGKTVNITSSKRIYLSDYVSEGIPFYRSKEIIELANGMNIAEPLYIDVTKYNELKAKFGAPKENDILITSVGTIGISHLIDNKVFYFKDGNLTWLQSSSNSKLALYLFLWLNSDIGKNDLLSSTIGTSQSALTIENLKRIKLIMPTEIILTDFYENAYDFVQQKRLLQFQNQNLARQRDLLLPRLMSGKTEVF